LKLDNDPASQHERLCKENQHKKQYCSVLKKSKNLPSRNINNFQLLDVIRTKYFNAKAIAGISNCKIYMLKSDTLIIGRTFLCRALWFSGMFISLLQNLAPVWPVFLQGSRLIDGGMPFILKYCP
jgi:hypothetical protein